MHQDWVWWHKQALPLGSDSEQAGEHSSGEPRVVSPCTGAGEGAEGSPDWGQLAS